MKSKYHLVLALLVMTVLTLLPNAALANGPGSAHMHARLFHNRAPHVHNHGSSSHHS
jgi:hypothetical protein